ncbi:DUF4185 domain-containing protein [Streptomyces sp. DG2A-72]|uniref:DUF4185 domain-containing protein n=1 Tax=Streptomyces sp. DG2A-72 TaxID=3051386 RepID=UPI00265C70EB|nr:DUF4185 domain-containing protein [Streptomyces sp. DG2A-72]MDO0939188.1 DUF4185 domain-containing protein [Streptomyces sp. DG2A-72]
MAPATARAASSPRQLQVNKIADLTGPGLTTRFRMEATDLGIPVPTADGRLLFFFGDTFEGPAVGAGWWRSPVALYSTTTDLNAGVTWSGAVGGEAAQQLWPYDHNNGEYSTILPTDGITIGSTTYLHVILNQGELGNVVRTELWRSDDYGATWAFTGATWPPDVHGGLFQQLSWSLGNDGFVYLYSTGFQRDKPIILQRVRAEAIADPAAYETWGFLNGAWAWGNPPTPILEGAFGELCLRPMPAEGKWILTWFNAGDYRIDAIVMDTPTSDLTTALRQTLIWGTDWGNEDDTHVAQLYGGYVIPGSTLNDLHLAVSQWHSEDNWPYRVMQFRARGLWP